MKDLSKYYGILPAFYACYDDNGDVSAERTEEFAKYLLEKGVKGLYVCGSSGECIYQSKEERKLILESVMKAVGDKLTIIAHVGCNNTKDSMELAAHAEGLGVDAIASIPPIYFRLPEESIAKYWNDISSAAPNTDFIIYNIPQLAGVALTMPLFKKMRENPRVIGVKNSSMPVQDIQMFKMEGGDDCVIFNGPDEQFISGRLIGASGGIGGTYAVMPELFLKADELLKNGDIQKACEIQHAIDKIIYAMCDCKCNMYAAAKQILREQGVNCGGVRAPLADLKEESIPLAHEVKLMIDEAIERFVK
ncbi:MAG: dihydrodipicolinate synthase family protein [Faecalibacterium sp.]|nr:dihydrodipicolinate synthase family protein [Ruminococcus sp.]MCM1391335.1 dihydrodipicolinate synthase family protein [Ruminococcus sp.]MCM1484894.1 dihydrodipicolinate synthase family protein [Faecalibacterium sp.]